MHCLSSSVACPFHGSLEENHWRLEVKKSQNNIALYKKEDSFLMYMEFGVRNPQFVDSYRIVNHPGSFCFVVSPSLTDRFYLKGCNDCSHPAITAESNHQKEGKGEV